MTPHDCSLAFLRFLLRDGLFKLCHAIRIRQTSDVFGAFTDSRKVSFKVNPFFHSKPHFQSAFSLCLELIDIPVIFTTPTMSLGNGFHVLCRRKQKKVGSVIVMSCSILNTWYSIVYMHQIKINVTSPIYRTRSIIRSDLVKNCTRC